MITEVRQLREQAAHIRTMAQYADGPAYHEELARARALDEKAEAIEAAIVAAAQPDNAIEA